MKETDPREEIELPRTTADSSSNSLPRAPRSSDGHSSVCLDVMCHVSCVMFRFSEPLSRTFCRWSPVAGMSIDVLAFYQGAKFFWRTVLVTLVRRVWVWAHTPNVQPSNRRQGRVVGVSYYWSKHFFSSARPAPAQGGGWSKSSSSSPHVSYLLRPPPV